MKMIKTKTPLSKSLLVTACTLLASDAAFLSSRSPHLLKAMNQQLRTNEPRALLKSLERDVEGSDSIVTSASGILLRSTCAAMSCLSDDLSSSFPQHFSYFSHEISEALNNRNVESEILTDIAHFALDLFTFMTPEKWLLRFAALIGRICSIVADYLPDNYIAPDEIVFQSIMIFVSSFLLAKSTFPMAVAGVSTIAQSTMKIGFDTNNMSFKASGSTSSWKNLFAWNYLFKPAGLTLFQFQCLSALGVIDWIDVEPNTVLIDKDCEPDHLFWMYKGSAELLFNGSAIEYLEPDEGLSVCLFADMNFLCKLQSKKKLENKSSDRSKQAEDCDVPLSCKLRNQAFIRSGVAGARLMRMDKKKLVELMEIDSDLADSVQNLLVKGMQSMLDALLSVEHPYNSNIIV